ncbi:hypothetical protein [Streptomyces sp. NPDC051183]|uniref:hypothetical protein n=1 Tax=unclassified Streptomyces TaxID=2593676 RepID=UPI003433EEBF
MTRTNSGLRRVHAIPVAVGLACGIYAFSLAVPRLATQLTGVDGTFRAERCTWEKVSAEDLEAACTGSFTASDGSFTISRIRAEGWFETPPTGPVVSRVSGPSADKAVRPGVITSLAPMGLGLVALAFPAWALTAAGRELLGRRRAGRGAPHAAVTSDM